MLLYQLINNSLFYFSNKKWLRRKKKAKNLAGQNQYEDIGLFKLIKRKYTIKELIDKPREVLIAAYLKIDGKYKLHWNKHLVNLLFTHPKYREKKVIDGF